MAAISNKSGTIVIDAAHDDYYLVSADGCTDLAYSAFLDPTNSNPVLPSAWPFVELNPQACQPENSPDSSSQTTTETTLVFFNGSSQELQPFRLDSKGQRIAIGGLIGPTLSIYIPAFAQQKFLVSNLEGQCLATYTAVETPGKIYLLDELLENQTLESQGDTDSPR